MNNTRSLHRTLPEPPDAARADHSPPEPHSFDARWSDHGWSREPDPESVRDWLGLAPTTTLATIPSAPPRELTTPADPGPTPRVASPQRFVPPEHRPAASSRSGRTFFQIMLWFTLITSLELWWLDTPARSLTNPADIWIAAGRITGMAGGFILLFQVLMMSRAGWLERWIGAHDLLIWHRDLGGYLLFAVLAHVATTIVGYALLSRKPVLGEAWTMVTTYEDMLSATAATAILVGIGVLAIRAVRRLMRYETWYYLHLASYLILILGYGHQFSTGQELSVPGFARSYWVALYVFVLANLVWGRVLAPLALNARHRLRVTGVVPEGQDMVSIYIGGRRLDRINARAGQYFRWRFLARGCWWQAHPFSLSAAPNHEWLRLTVKVVGDHTEELQYLEPGVRVFAEGPSGVFTADRSVKRRALLIAGGSGIAPIRALLEDLPPGTIMLYRASTPADVVFRRELDWLARERGAEVWYVIGGRDEPGPRHLFTPGGMRQLIPDVARRDIFLCGPPGLVGASLETLRRLRVPRRQIHLDPFEF